MLVRNDTVPSSVKGTVHAGTELIAATFENVTVTSIYKPPPAKLTFPPDVFDMNRNNNIIIIGELNSHNICGDIMTMTMTRMACSSRSGSPRTTFTSPTTPSCRTLSTAVGGSYNPDLACVPHNIRDTMPTESARPHTSLTTPPSWGRNQPHDHPFGAAFPLSLQLQKCQLETFTTTLDNGITSLASPSWKAYKSFSDLVRVCARKCIPRGCRTKYISGLTPEYGELLKHYQELYDVDPFSEDTVEAGIPT